MTSDVKADLQIELTDLNYMYLRCHASLACKGFFEMIHMNNNGANIDPLTLQGYRQLVKGS